MKLLTIFSIVFPLSLVGQMVLDYRNDYLIYWVKTNQVKKLTTEYPDTYSIDNKTRSTTQEELVFNELNGKVQVFKSFLSYVDTVEYPKISYLMQQTKADTTYLNPFGIPTQTFTINNWKYTREYLTDDAGELIIEHIRRVGLNPVYYKYLSKYVSFDRENRIEKIQTNHLYGNNEWEYIFDTLSIATYSYSSNTVNIITKEEVIELDKIHKPSNTYSITTRSIKHVDTLILNTDDLNFKQLQLYFGKENIDHLIKVEHNNIQTKIGDRFKPAEINLDQSIEYIDTISNKRIFRKPPLVKHQPLIQPNFGTQEVQKYRWGKRVKNYYFDDTNLLLAEVIELDNFDREINYYYRHFHFDLKNSRFTIHDESTNSDWEWEKTSFEYIDNQPFIEKISKQKGVYGSETSPEHMRFKKSISINRFEQWITSHIESINEKQLQLKTGNESYLVNISK